MNQTNKIKRDIYNAGASIFFLILLTIMTFGLIASRGIFPIDVAQFALLSLAVFRLIRLFVYDSITQFFRDWFLKLEYRDDGSIERSKHEFGLARTVSDILSCPWCSGVWIGTPYIFMFFMFPYPMYFITIVLALTAVASMLQIIANLIGWQAESMKNEVKK